MTTPTDSPADDPAAAIAGRLEAVDTETARISRLAFDARFQRWMHALLRTRLAFGQRSLAAADTTLEVESAQGLFELVLDSKQWPALDMALAMDDDECACAVASVLLSDWCGALAPLLGSLRVTRRARIAPSKSSLPPVTVIGSPQAAVGLQRVQTQLASQLRQGLARAPAGALPALAQLRLPGRIVLMQRVLPAELLAGLGTGDTVLLDPAGRRAPAYRFIFGRGMTMQVPTRLENGDSFVAQAAPSLADDAQQTPEQNTIDELQVPVSFEIDSARVSLAELASIRPGYVIELDRPVVAAVVRLVCHGQTVGHGQLVAVGDQMGVRIVRMGLPAGQVGED
ncbi:type III secretion system cytoplasmic ring protein SctQ [Aquincola sp. S2]|uniref:Type III secretion system cytoplasmic ring protein SctQ n=1 Tax=Pseudaquabacterium terrae TaxID=2732868 RepID=A0ABX2EIN2_9BURK|nr:type III secretion system cytoplasmic ring protein SctQ [Aquabacterium terrae]NRF68487.1 type III secretion system cytoplasmic ring protein SctQ [Aquabacterium terrae]